MHDPRFDAMTDDERRGAQLMLAHLRARAARMQATARPGAVSSFTPSQRAQLRAAAAAIKSASDAARAELAGLPKPWHVG